MCDHQPTSIQGVVSQAPDGHWFAVFVTPEGTGCRSVRYCPFCGVELWGRRQPAPAVIPAMAHAEARV